MTRDKRIIFNSQFQIENRVISEQEKTFIVAEAGEIIIGICMCLAKGMFDVLVDYSDYLHGVGAFPYVW